MMKLTVLIPTHNPRAEFLDRTLAALRAQTLPVSAWELLLIDNRSDVPLSAALVAWHPQGRIVPAPMLGLTHARIAGTEAASGDILVWVDDDNLLAPDYLEIVLRLFRDNPRLGAAGGKSLPDYESPPPSWYRPGLAPLGCRDLGDTPQEVRWEPNQPRSYPAAAPIGAGLAIRREALMHWVGLIKTDPVRQSFGRTGSALTSGEDNDINLTLLAAGWSLAYEPTLRLTHLIPPRRLTLDYQCRIARASFRDFVRVLALHNIRPWPAVSPAGVHARQLKSWFTQRAWRSPADRIRWQGSCGQIEGRSTLSSRPSARPTRFLSQLKTALYRRPLDEFCRLRRWGPWAYLRCDAWAREMEQAAWHRLAPLPPRNGEPVFVYFMTGARHWYQTAFCAWSLQHQIAAPLHVQIIDDGTLTPEISTRLRELIPLLHIDSRSSCDASVAAHLPPARYPRIHAWRNIQLLFRKLTDLHVGGTTWKLFLDSDMLFFHPPVELTAWWSQPDRGIFQTDCTESYGYSRALVEKLAGVRLLDSVNIGIFALNGALIDWDEIEDWLDILETTEGRRYNITQCITTMLLSRLSSERLDPHRYQVFAGPGQPAATSTPVLRHYVSDAKPHYLGRAWREIISP